MPMRGSRRFGLQRVAPVVGDGGGRATLDCRCGLHEQIAHERRFRRTPRRGAGRSRVADREEVEQAESFAVGFADRGEIVGDGSVGKVAPRRVHRRSAGGAERATARLPAPRHRTRAAASRVAPLPRRLLHGRPVSPWRCRAAVPRPRTARAGDMSGPPPRRIRRSFDQRAHRCAGPRRGASRTRRRLPADGDQR